MKNINFRSLIIASFFAAITFLISEFIIESAFKIIFNLSESAYYTTYDIDPTGISFHALNLIIFFSLIVLIMFNYALVRNRFTSDIYASLVTSAIFLGMSFLVFANLTNLGIFSIEMCCTSFLFNLIELPPSILLGAVIYKQG